VPAAEAKLVGVPVEQINPALIGSVAEEAAAGARPITDVRTTAAYRREISRVLVKRALEETVARLREGGMRP
jgi:CO/xanthine dehydrogenase FAD-binding subunit